MPSIEGRVRVNKFRPIGKYVVIKRDSPDTRIGDIVIPEEHQESNPSGIITKVSAGAQKYFQENEKVLFFTTQGVRAITPFRDIGYVVTSIRNIPAKLAISKKEEKIQPMWKNVLIFPEEDVTKKGEILLSDNSIKYANKGKVIRIGEQCEIFVGGETVYYIADTATELYEGQQRAHLLSEDEIECIIEE